MAREQRRLERLTLNDPNFEALFKKLQDDLDTHTWGQFETRMEQLGKRIATEMANCPYMHKAVKILMKMKDTVNNIIDGRFISDSNKKRIIKQWETNPFEGMKVDEEFLL